MLLLGYSGYLAVELRQLVWMPPMQMVIMLLMLLAHWKAMRKMPNL